MAVALAIILVLLTSAGAFWGVRRIDLTIPTEHAYAKVLVTNLQGISLGGVLIFFIGLVTGQVEAAIYGLAVAGCFGFVYHKFKGI